MAQEKVPAFQFYPKDFLSDENVIAMSHTERGIYITLLAICWMQGSLPAAVPELARLAHMPTSRFNRIWHGPLERCFQANGDGRLHHKRLDKEREKQDQFRRRQSDAAAVRWEKAGNPKPVPEPCSSSSSPSSSSVRALESAPKSSLADEEHAKRAGVLVERYGQWFLQERQGARYRPRPNLDWQEALTLVPIWDDARLEKLARIVLTTDDPFISRTDRSFKIFAMKASWADDRLKQWERENGVTV